MPALKVVHVAADTQWTPQPRATRVAAIQRLAAKIDTGQPAPAQSARALLMAMHAERPDHIGLAISAHRLLAPAVLRDIDDIGQTGPGQAELLTALCSYLDNEYWNIGHDGRFYPSDDPRQLGGKARE